MTQEGKGTTCDTRVQGAEEEERKTWINNLSLYKTDKMEVINLFTWCKINRTELAWHAIAQETYRQWITLGRRYIFSGCQFCYHKVISYNSELCGYLSPYYYFHQIKQENQFACHPSHFPKIPYFKHYPRQCH